MQFLRIKTVCSRVGLSKASLYKFIKAGSFPASISIGERAVGWLESDIDAWIAKRVKASKDSLGE